MNAVSTTARSFGQALHQLWLEVTGLVFLVMAPSFAGASCKEYGKYQAGQVGFGRVAIAICFTVTFAWFGVSSFWRVRRKEPAAIGRTSPDQQPFQSGSGDNRWKS